MTEEKNIFFPVYSLEPGSLNVIGEGKNRKPTYNMKVIPAGVFVAQSSGAYSDFMVSGLYRTLKETDPNSLLRGWLEAHPDQLKDYQFDSTGFLEWVVELGFMERLEYWSWHTDDYGGACEMSVME